MWIENFKELKEMGVPLFECGSPKLAQHISEELGMRPIHVYRHKITNRLIQVFIKNKELENILAEWSANNPKNKKDHSK